MPRSVSKHRLGSGGARGQDWVERHPNSSDDCPSGGVLQLSFISHSILIAAWGGGWDGERLKDEEAEAQRLRGMSNVSGIARI